MEQFIDIHTHQLSKDGDIFQLSNVFPNEQIPFTPFSIGIHPWHISKTWMQQMQEVAETATAVNCFAIGECGLDKLAKVDFNLQREVFEAHLHLANKLCKPLVIHCVKAYDVLFGYLERINVPIIVHDFSRNAMLAKQLQQKGVYLSVGRALFRKSFVNVLPQLDRKRFFLETDDMECSIEEIYHRAATILDEELLSLQRQIQQNFKTVF